MLDLERLSLVLALTLSACGNGSEEAADDPDDGAPNETDNVANDDPDDGAPNETDNVANDDPDDGAPEANGPNDAASPCGADVWHCIDQPASPGAEPGHCKENGPTPFGSAENLARSGCGDRATMGPCPRASANGGWCQWETGMVCYVDVNHQLDETQRGTARNGCFGTWTDG